MKQIIGQPLVLKDGTKVPLSPAIKANGLLFLSGQLGLTAEMSLIGDDVESQTKQALDNVSSLLSAAGSHKDNIIKTTIWLTDKSDFPAFNKVYSEFFQTEFPTRSTVVSSLLIPGAKVEIEVIASCE